MNALKLFEEYVKEGIAKHTSLNKEMAKSLVAESERKMLSLKERLEKIGVRNENANDYIEYCYDLLLALIRARLHLDGYSTGGQGAHEAEVSYLRVLGFAEKDVQFADSMRYFRNRILYIGSVLDAEYAERVIEFTHRIYPELRAMVLC